MAARVNKAFAQIQIQINKLISNNPDCEITSLVFDTFGFSRGAAAARHFANEVVRCNHGALNVIVRSNSGGYGRHFANRFGSDVHMGFIGLFDTVASVAGVTNMGNIQTSPIAPVFACTWTDSILPMSCNWPPATSAGPIFH